MSSPTSSSSNVHEILVLGGNFGGVNVIHHLLRVTIPTLERLDQSKTYHITLVTPNTHFFFKIGSPRALINPTALPESKLLRPLSEAFSQYNSSQFNLVQGVASSLDPTKRTVTVKTSTVEIETQLHYDSLIISTGTTSKSPLWSLHNDQSLTSKALESMHEALPKAKTVLIVGGGAVGVETAGEIAVAYPDCKVTLLSGASRVLERVKEATSLRAQAYLDKLHVEVIHNVRVESTDPPHPSTSPTTLKLSDGSSRTVDLYVDATGGKPNSDYLPSVWLDEAKRVITKDSYFRVKGSGSDDVRGTYVIGDLVAGSSMAALEIDPMVTTVCSSLAVDIAADLKGAKKDESNPGLLGSLLGLIGVGGSSGGYPKQLEFKPMKETIFVPIGPSGGVGQIMGWRLPSFMVYMGKCKSFLIELVDPIISGSKWKKA